MIPDFVSLGTASSVIPKASALLLGAQDCFYADHGAYTGEVSPAVLKEVGCSVVELGHAERRKLFGETDENVAKKATAVLKNGMAPLVCIGEVTRLQTADAGQGIRAAVAECKVQVESVLRALDTEIQSKEGEQGDVVFAYEPVWAIGAAEPASAEYVVEVVKGLRGVCEQLGWGGRVRFLYGGSAGPGTFEGMKEAVDGLFLGRFAHDVGNLEKVIKEVGGGL